MEEKRKDLIVTKQKEIVNAIVAELNTSNPSFYYLSTSEIAAEVKSYIDNSGKVSSEQKKIVGDLSQRDIQMLLSLH